MIHVGGDFRLMWLYPKGVNPFSCQYSDDCAIIHAYTTKQPNPRGVSPPAGLLDIALINKPTANNSEHSNSPYSWVLFFLLAHWVLPASGDLHPIYRSQNTTWLLIFTDLWDDISPLNMNKV